jgi:hypothetical protein
MRRLRDLPRLLSGRRWFDPSQATIRNGLPMSFGLSAELARCSLSLGDEVRGRAFGGAFVCGTCIRAICRCRPQGSRLCGSSIAA